MGQLTHFTQWAALKKNVETLNYFPGKKSHKLQAPYLTLDYSSQRINQNTIDLLISLAKCLNIKQKIQDLMNGEFVNKSENRPALHTALRIQSKRPVYVSGADIVPAILAAREKMKVICDKIRAKEWLGFSNKPITDIVNIGIGGSDLGPKFCVNALANYIDDSLGYHFISDAESESFSSVCCKLNPETTIFIIASKSFSTKETLYNTKKAMDWFAGHKTDNHFIGVTAYEEKAFQYGIRHVLPIWDWVGGRYSVCSAINLITAIAIGYETFCQFLLGAHEMDAHFSTAPLGENFPVLLALLGIWNINFLNIHNLLILTYSKHLQYFVPYIQQLDMESNGKSIDNFGQKVDYSTGPIVWGGSGNQAQHSYFQLLCQGTHKTAVDFITLNSNKKELIQALQASKKKVLTYGVKDKTNLHGFIAGNIPSSQIQLPQCTPEALGSLISSYEHKIYIQGVIWNINPFDQPGIMSAKLKHMELV
ncbi:MAG: glucose-6-phosphate isomerase [Legionella sp.]|nr:glucose-6-phosphate isomerase [Legionella sp.]